MSNPGDRWRRAWLLPLAALVAVLGLVLARCASDNSGDSTASDVVAGAPAAVTPFGFDLGTNGLLLSGDVPTEAEHQAIVAAAKAAWPGVSVVDQIQVVAGAPSIGDANALFAGLKGAKPIFSLKSSQDGITIEGIAASAQERDAFGAAVAAATGRTVDNRLTVADAAPATDAPATEAPATEAPVTEAPVTEAAAPSTDAPSTEAPATDAPATEAPTTEAPATTTTVAPEAAAAAQAIADEIKLTGIEFLSGSATLTDAAKATLDEVAKTLADHPDVKVQIGGHTDSSGNAAANKKLSQQRADAVRAYLVSKGVDGARMTAVGFGADKPIADNATAAGRTKNRRIEFTPA